VSRPVHLMEVGMVWPPEPFVRRKLDALSAAGMRVTVASCIPRGVKPVALPGIELLRLPHWTESRARRFLGVLWEGPLLALRHPRRARALLAAVRGPLAPRLRTGARQTVGLLRAYTRLARQQPDIVQYEWESAAVGYLPMTEVWECPVLMACHGGNVYIHPHDPIAHWTPRLPHAFARAEAVHCVSEAVRREARRYGLRDEKTRIIKAGVDTGFFSPNGAGPTGEAPLRLVTVASFHWCKGYEYALEALAHLAEVGVPARLDVLGGDLVPEHAIDGDRERILDTAADLALDGTVRLHGEVTRAQVRDRLREADVLLQPSLVEGLPNSVLEGMACGLPVVATDCGGVREAVRDGVEGLLVPPRDTRALARALERLWRDPALRLRLGRAGRARAETEFAPDRERDGFLSLYSEVASR
jgi:glycosyltransferase involved in cell wall biosynthesis